MIKERTARQQISDSSGSRLWQALETATTFGITSIISAIFVAGVLYIGNQLPDSAPQSVFRVIARMTGPELAEEAQRFVQQYETVVYLRIGDREFASDSERLALLRPTSWPRRRRPFPKQARAIVRNQYRAESLSRRPVA